ncbi:MAG: aminotransferase class V-fold PLP-dependent enzyme [candidate division Zixibacteria bacterium]|nr:aminotransferase class V-fold PLP-dependent enzyme [candidate division Zixibacteria bacterium]
MVFFDASSTTPVDKRVVEKMLPYFGEKYGNPSSHIHSVGVEAGKALDDARGQVAELINARPGEVYFTSGATESNNLAVVGYLNAHPDSGKHIILSEIEHFSILNIGYKLKRLGYEVDFLPVDNNGLVSSADLENAITPRTSLVSIQHASSEIGTIQNIKRLAEIAHQSGIFFHTDSTAGAGNIPADVEDLGVDCMTLSAHNFYGPKGAGAIYLKNGMRVSSLFEGGFQEDGLRPGTENLPGIVGMGAASELAMREIESRNKKLVSLRQKFWNGLNDKIEFIHFTGHPEKRLPGHVSFWIEFVEGESLQLMLSMQGIMASSGSACSSNLKGEDEEDLKASHVLSSVGVPEEFCSGSLTFNMTMDADESDVDYVLDKLPPIVERLMSMSPMYADYLKKRNDS